ncbi:Dual specificity phosphatase DUPD1 [Bagarius yarrelli]|uniref:Dual specificity phosphatase DUPD1 n=1 Tax=Bagarius yarrelli TaxID=175774 RepID=A0A556VXL7_BAGYA|nr:Dual specificity phosphatase DUPD1 [Bagarius yarrelli]
MDPQCKTPSVKDLEKILYGGKRSGNHVDEVWPNLFLGDMSIANDRYSLWKLGITHVLNAAHGKAHCLGSHGFYGQSVEYYGVPADDSPSFNLSRYFQPGIAQNRTALQRLGITHILNAAHSKRGSIGDQRFYGASFVYCGIPADDSTHFDLDIYFRPAAEFIHKGLRSVDGKVLVHCIMGMSRSSSLVLAYLMLYHHMSLRSAIHRLVQKRAIYPNRNFLALLLDLDLQLKRKRRTCILL